MAVEEAVDEVQVAGAAAARTDCDRTRQGGLGAGREGRHLLVTDVYPLDPALRPDRLGQAVQAVADDAVDPGDSGVG